MQDRRLFKRWQINRPSKVKLEGAQAFASCIIKDISFKGMQFSLGLRLPKDTFLKLTLDLSGEFCFQPEAWIVWHKIVEGINIYGIYFSKISDADKEKIYRFIFNNFPEQIHKRWWQGLTKEKGGEQMEDRRIFERLSVKFPLRYLEPKSGREGKGQTEDISAKGIGLSASQEFSPQTPLEMWIEIPDKGEPLYTRGEVVWSKRLEPNKYRIGANLEKADLMRLSRLLRAT